jgi:hypothetical protein
VLIHVQQGLSDGGLTTNQIVVYVVVYIVVSVSLAGVALGGL